jgi:hypothetical protein
MLELIAVAIVIIAGVSAVALMLYMAKRDDRAFLEHMKNDEVKKASQPAQIFDDEKLNKLTEDIRKEGIITEEDIGISEKDQNALDDKYEEVAEECEEAIIEPSFSEEAAKMMPKKLKRKLKSKKGRKIAVGRPKGAKNKKVKKVAVAEAPVADAEEAKVEETIQ